MIDPMTNALGSMAQAREDFLALVSDVRPELHRYCARLTGSVIEGEDIVQDTLAKAFYAMSMAPSQPPLRPWLFRIAHNAALDFLKSQVSATVGLAGHPQPGKPRWQVSAASFADGALPEFTPNARLLPQQSVWKTTDTQSMSARHDRSTGFVVPVSRGSSGVGQTRSAGRGQPLAVVHPEAAASSLASGSPPDVPPSAPPDEPAPGTLLPVALPPQAVHEPSARTSTARTWVWKRSILGFLASPVPPRIAQKNGLE
jgi:hypothetical protein